MWRILHNAFNASNAPGPAQSTNDNVYNAMVSNHHLNEKFHTLKVKPTFIQLVQNQRQIPWPTITSEGHNMQLCHWLDAFAAHVNVRAEYLYDATQQTSQNTDIVVLQL